MKLSIVSHYYNNLPAVRRVISSFADMERRHPGQFDFVLVDDHSSDLVPEDEFAKVQNLRVFRIREDVAWNMPAARNIGVFEAACDKILLIDVDHIVNPEHTTELLALAERMSELDKYVFRRFATSGTDRQEVRYHLNSFLMTKAGFEKAGGFEELFSGHYGCEDKYFAVCCRSKGMIEKKTTEVELLVERGLHTPHLNRDKTLNLEILNSLMSEGHFRAKKVLAYPYDRVV